MFCGSLASFPAVLLVLNISNVKDFLAVLLSSSLVPNLVHLSFLLKDQFRTCTWQMFKEKWKKLLRFIMLYNYLLVIIDDFVFEYCLLLLSDFVEFALLCTDLEMMISRDLKSPA